jgi:hypothetical protein
MFVLDGALMLAPHADDASDSQQEKAVSWRVVSRVFF